MSDLFHLTGRTALVTGSTRGIGRALATGLDLSSAFYCARRVARGMITRGSGKIVQTGSCSRSCWPP